MNKYIDEQIKYHRILIKDMKITPQPLSVQNYAYKLYNTADKVADQAIKTHRIRDDEDLLDIISIGTMSAIIGGLY